MKNKGSRETETSISKQESIFQSTYSVLVTGLLSIQTVLKKWNKWDT